MSVSVRFYVAGGVVLSMAMVDVDVNVDIVVASGFEKNWPLEV
jgi:hypothetical protein